MTRSFHRQHDVVVVGARCAGASTAMLLMRAGHDVAVVDRSPLPSDTVSTLDRPSWCGAARPVGLLDAVLATGAPAVRAVDVSVGRPGRHAVGEGPLWRGPARRAEAVLPWTRC